MTKVVYLAILQPEHTQWCRLSIYISTNISDEGTTPNAKPQKRFSESFALKKTHFIALSKS